jgi:hypothetical protein
VTCAPIVICHHEHIDGIVPAFAIAASAELAPPLTFHLRSPAITIDFSIRRTAGRRPSQKRSVAYTSSPAIRHALSLCRDQGVKQIQPLACKIGSRQLPPRGDLGQKAWPHAELSAVSLLPAGHHSECLSNQASIGIGVAAVAHAPIGS